MNDRLHNSRSFPVAATCALLGVVAAVSLHLLAVAVAATMMWAPFGAAVRPMGQALMICCLGAIGVCLVGPCCLLGCLPPAGFRFRLVCGIGALLGFLCGPFGIGYVYAFAGLNGLTFAK